MDLETVLLGVQERDKWRRRVEALEQSLQEVREQRKKVQSRLRRTRREMGKLRSLQYAVLDAARTLPVEGQQHGARGRGPNLPAR